MRNLDFLTMLNLTTQLYKSLCALLAKVTMVILQLKKTLSISHQRDAARVPVLLPHEGEIPQAIPEGSTAYGPVFSMFFCPLLSLNFGGITVTQIAHSPMVNVRDFC